jgi:hypothetical protein
MRDFGFSPNDGVTVDLHTMTKAYRSRHGSKGRIGALENAVRECERDRAALWREIRPGHS